MLVREAVQTVRSMVTGSMMDEVSVLGAPYDPDTDLSITLRYAKRNAGQGAVISVGLNTFIVTNVSSDGLTLEVIPSADGGPNVACPENEIVYFRPTFTTWAVVRELQSEIDSMSSPDVGLYQPWTVMASELAWTSGTYEIPVRDDGRYPFRLLRSEYQVRGVGSTQVFTDAEFQITTNSIRVFSDPRDMEGLRFTLALPFGRIVDLSTDYADIGLDQGLTDIPSLGAASTMVLGWEGRRTQPMSQGDTRRAGEVGANTNATLSARWRQRQKDAIESERARLIGMYGYRIPLSYGYEQSVFRGGR